MRKAITVICTIGALLLILDSMNAANSLLLFVFAGVVPGTNILISPTAMMSLSAAAIVIVIFRLIVVPIFRDSVVIEPIKTHSKHASNRVA